MKTACEEAAERFGMIAHLKREEGSTDYADYADGLVKRLRAEGRELKRLRKAVFLWKYGSFKQVGEACNTLDREATRIQKARKAK